MGMGGICVCILSTLIYLIDFLSQNWFNLNVNEFLDLPYCLYSVIMPKRYRACGYTLSEIGYLLEP